MIINMPKNRIIPIFIPHCGCPNMCVFCDQRTIAGVTRAPSPEEVAADIEAGLARSGEGAELAFYGGSFTAIPRSSQEAYLRAAEPFVRSGRLSGIRLSTRPDAVDEGTPEFLRSFGVHTVELGAQSMEDGALRLSKRGHTAADTERASGIIRRSGLSLVLQLMPGLPGETDPMHTARAAAELGPDGVRIYPVVVIAGTELSEMYRRGEYEPLSVERAVEICAGLCAFFEEKGITVIRCGLNPSVTLTPGVEAGAYHPAFGELVTSRRLRGEIEKALEGRAGERLEITLPAVLISAAVGNKKSNIEYLKAKYGFKEIKVTAGTQKNGLCIHCY